jgi:hypothetical protein
VVVIVVPLSVIVVVTALGVRTAGAVAVEVATEEMVEAGRPDDVRLAGILATTPPATAFAR